MQGEHTLRINRPGVIFENIDGELILVNLEKGCYFSTDPVGAVIWEMIGDGHPVGEIIEVLRQRYDGPADEIVHGTTAFIERLENEDLVVTADRPAPTSVSPWEGARVRFRAPELQKYTDMRDMLLLDPVHDVEAAGWPVPKIEPAWPAPEVEP